MNLFKNLIYMQNIKAINKPILIITNIKKSYNHLKLAFRKVSIL